MPKIYVPQGFSARMYNTSSKISALYTDGFSTCTVIVAVSQDKSKCLLVHMEAITPPAFLEEDLQWLGEYSQITLIHRTEGEHSKKTIMEFFKSKRILIKTEFMPSDKNGVQVTNNPTHDLQFLSHQETPTDLIHHPDEQQATAIRKIELIIGIRAKRELQSVRSRTFTLFDGAYWNPLLNCLEIDATHPLTRQEMSQFNSEDSQMEIWTTLYKFFSSHPIPILGNIVEICRDAAPYLQAYLNHFDHVRICRINLKDLLTDNSYKARYGINKESTDFINNALKRLDEENPITQFIQFLEEFKTSRLPYIQAVIKESREYLRLFNLSENWLTQKKRQQDLKKAGVEYSIQAIKALNEQDFEQAIALNIKALDTLSWAMLKSNPSLASVLFNLGKSYLANENTPMAFATFTSCHHLMQHHTTPKPNAEKLTAVMQAISDCSEKSSKRTPSFS